MAYSDLIVEVFMVLRDNFYTPNGTPKQYHLRDKRSTQDDPLDEYIYNVLSGSIKNAHCQKASGPLISPDLVILRPELCNGVDRGALRDDLSRIVAIEVKKIQRTTGGAVARASGLDYNTTPPCGTVRVYDVNDMPLDIRGFYLFVCQEPVPKKANTYQLTALALCDGNVLNDDFDLYCSIVGPREKKIHLGTYHNGADRTRPMFIFANPLGSPELDHAVTLIHPTQDLSKFYKKLGFVYQLLRSSDNKKYVFYCYRKAGDIQRDHKPRDLIDPFPTPSRETRTQPRGKIRLAIQPL